MKGNGYQIVPSNCSHSAYQVCCILLHGYDKGRYIKDREHKRRVGKVNVNLDLQMEVTCNQEIFLKDDKNKSQFISLLSDVLKQEKNDVRNSDGDADTQIISPALENASNRQNEVLVASDTVILVLLMMFHWEAGMKMSMFQMREKARQ